MVVDQTTIEHDWSGSKIRQLGSDNQLAQVFDTVTDPVRARSNGEHNRDPTQAGIRFQMQKRRRIVRLFVKGIRSKHLIGSGDSQVNDIGVCDSD